MANLKDKSALRRAKEKEAMGDKDLWTAEERAAYAKAYSEEQKKRGNKPGKPTKGLFDGNAQDKKGKEAVDDYEKDFDTEATIAELKKKKEELLKGISGKSEAEKKKIRKQLEELNDDIMDLESR